MRAAFLIALLVFATGCATVPAPSLRAELLGVWESSDKGSVARIELNGDGSLRAVDLPRAATSLEDTEALTWEETVDLTGTWKFFEAGLDRFSQPRLSVSIDQPGQTLSLQPRAGGLDLYYGDVEIGRHLDFQLVETPPYRAPATVSREDLVGRWRSDGDGTLQLKEDGSFELKDAPLSEFLDKTAPKGVAGDLSGQWTFAEEPLPLDPLAGVLLSFDRPEGSQTEMFYSMDPTLYAIEGGFALQLSAGEPRWALDASAR